MTQEVESKSGETTPVLKALWFMEVSLSEVSLYSLAKLDIALVSGVSQAGYFNPVYPVGSKPSAASASGMQDGLVDHPSRQRGTRSKWNLACKAALTAAARSVPRSAELCLHTYQASIARMRYPDRLRRMRLVVNLQASGKPMRLWKTVPMPFGNFSVS